jgi:chromosomal replication initiation ATPase DnaA
MNTLNVNMSEKKELETFFKNVQQSLKKYTLNEINESLQLMANSETNNKKDKDKEISIVLDAICKEYSIEKDILIYGKSKKDLQQARNIAYCILHLDLGLPIRYIAKRIFFLNWHNSVGVAIKYHKSLNVNIAPDRNFKEKLETVQKTIVLKKSKK